MWYRDRQTIPYISSPQGRETTGRMSGGRTESLLGEMDEDVAVGVEDLGFGDKTEVSAVLIDDGQVPGTGVLEDLHHFLHR